MSISDLQTYVVSVFETEGGPPHSRVYEDLKKARQWLWEKHREMESEYGVHPDYEELVELENLPVWKGQGIAIVYGANMAPGAVIIAGKTPLRLA